MSPIIAAAAFILFVSTLASHASAQAPDTPPASPPRYSASPFELAVGALATTREAQDAINFPGRATGAIVELRHVIGQWQFMLAGGTSVGSYYGVGSCTIRGPIPWTCPYELRFRLNQGGLGVGRWVPLSPRARLDLETELLTKSYHRFFPNGSKNGPLVNGGLIPAAGIGLRQDVGQRFSLSARLGAAWQDLWKTEVRPAESQREFVFDGRVMLGFRFGQR